jgi:hypothetical protein
MLLINLSFVATASACDFADEEEPDLSFKKDADDLEP